jgi:N-acetylglucosaminyldiphosphoundecaprenol N-acetyl-beta-D-mannosaminyltransferase
MVEMCYKYAMSERVEHPNLLGVPFSNVGFEDVCSAIDERITSREPGYIVTPNVNLVCNFHRYPDFREAYRKAFMWLPDGTPLMWVARLLGIRFVEKLSGSDMVPWLSAYAAKKGYRVFLLGGRPCSAEVAAQRLQQKNPGLQIAGWYCPPFGFEHDPQENALTIQAVKDARPDILFVALGSPKQELWLARHLTELDVPVSMGVGAALDFIAGKLRRAPRWMQHTGLEWVWRLFQEPRRLWRRYLVDDMMIVPMILREIVRGRRNGSEAENEGRA